MFFEESDYEVFTEKNNNNDEDAIKKQRQKLQEKLLTVSDGIETEMNKLKLYHHKDRAYITTKICRDRSSNSYNTWLLVRYGKSPMEIDMIKTKSSKVYRKINEEDEEYAFHKHACIQFGLFEHKDFEIALFIGWSKGYDRQGYITKIINNKEDVISEISKLKGLNARWVIIDDNCEKKFDFDKEDPSTFIRWIRENDNMQNHSQSFLSICYNRDNPVLSDIKSIKEEILEKSKLLNGLYGLLVFRYGI